MRKGVKQIIFHGIEFSEKYNFHFIFLQTNFKNICLSLSEKFKILIPLKNGICHPFCDVFYDYLGILILLRKKDIEIKYM